ncbi:MAG: hypothetical protein H0W89_04935 [Candidatus Levybacteria bacterium]|nr:hypothetical protein [Candidatus Levybacteria bacterium]
MLAALIIILAVLWFLGYLRIDGLSIPDTSLFAINGQTISIVDLLVLALVATAVSILPSPFREVAGVLLILWILAVLGVLAITGLSLPGIILIAIIIGLVVALFRNRTV